VLLRGENIRINIGQVIKGKPLKLLEPIRVSGELQISQSHLQASLTSTLLASAFAELLVALLTEQGVENPQEQLQDYTFLWQAIALEHQSFQLKGEVQDPQGQSHDLLVQARLQLASPKTLHLEDITLLGLPAIANQNLERLTVDLGEDVDLESLDLNNGELFCLGRVLIRP
jgi:hypothetical protein